LQLRKSALLCLSYHISSNIFLFPFLYAHVKLEKAAWVIAVKVYAVYVCIQAAAVIAALLFFHIVF
jgi:hypothetical protein